MFTKGHLVFTNVINASISWCSNMFFVSVTRAACVRGSLELLGARKKSCNKNYWKWNHLTWLCKVRFIFCIHSSRKYKSIFRVLPELNISNLRLEIEAQLDHQECPVPESYIFIRNVGRHFAMVSIFYFLSN